MTVVRLGLVFLEPFSKLLFAEARDDGRRARTRFKDDPGDVVCRAGATESPRVFAHRGDPFRIVEQAGKLVIEHGYFGYI